MDLAAARALGAGIATLGMMGVGIGIGYLFGRLIEAIGRNPSVKNELFPIGLLGFALTESIALLIFVVVMILLFVK
jgi:F0F1-type ATP synthase membrane subunit c/vacuolar-type H+-ATPase subunit K